MPLKCKNNIHEMQNDLHFDLKKLLIKRFQDKFLSKVQKETLN